MAKWDGVLRYTQSAMLEWLIVCKLSMLLKIIIKTIFNTKLVLYVSYTLCKIYKCVCVCVYNIKSNIKVHSNHTKLFTRKESPALFCKRTRFRCEPIKIKTTVCSHEWYCRLWTWHQVSGPLALCAKGRPPFARIWSTHLSLAVASAVAPACAPPGLQFASRVSSTGGTVAPMRRRPCRSPLNRTTTSVLKARGNALFVNVLGSKLRAELSAFFE